jgi:hypothetical protein
MMSKGYNGVVMDKNGFPLRGSWELMAELILEMV